jgi:choice-of-anchor B domain-containing protein
MRLLTTSVFACLLMGSLWAQNTNVTLRSKTVYSGQVLSNIWGYAAGGKEYALIGGRNGLIITDVTNPTTPVQITQIAGPASDWREIKTYQNFAYVATEGGGGLQIVNLANLPGSNLTVTNYTGGGTTPAVLNTIHALQVDEAKGYLYLYGTNLVSGKALVFDLNVNPAAPVYKGYFNGVGYAHDGYVNNDTMYVGHINNGLVSIVDMTVKTGANNQIGVPLCTPFNTPLNFSHNTWRYGNTLFTTDEKPNSTLASYDISDLSDIRLLDQIQSNPGNNSIVHNTYIRNGYAITSWYVDGIAIVDVSRPDNLVKVGSYDTYTNTSTGFNGAWGVYPFLPSGNILVSNINGTSSTSGEMFVLTPNYQRGCYIEGNITDAVTGNPILGAKAELLSTTTSHVAPTGVYKMGQLQSGTYTLQVTKTGYQPFTQSITIANGVVTNVNVALNPATCTYATINSQNFDASWGIWTDGGTDCARINNATYANSGTYSIQLRDNTTTSLMTTSSLNCLTYSEIKVSFSYISVSFDGSAEDLWLQMSTNGGTTYTTVADFDNTVHFNNNVRQNTTVTIPGPFTTNTRFRFRADASADDDVVYIDDVVISGCVPGYGNNGGSSTESIGTNNEGAAVQVKGDLEDFRSGPNPAFDTYTMQFSALEGTQVTYMVTDISGKVLLQDQAICSEGLNEINLNVGSLQRGTYIVHVRTDRSGVSKKLVIAR